MAGTANYALPATVDKVLRVSIGGVPFHRQDEQAVQWVGDAQGFYSLEPGSGVYYETTSSSGGEQISLYPVPSAASPILAVCVVYPTDIDSTHEPVTPLRCDRYIWHYAAGQAFLGTEDDTDQAEYYAQKFDGGAELVRQLRYSRMGRQPFQARILGVV